jgi:hypothetical protein
VPEADSGGGASGSAESGRDTGAGKGMTGGVGCGAGEGGEAGWRRQNGPKGRAGPRLRFWAAAIASWLKAKKKNGLLLGLEWGWAEKGKGNMIGLN